MRRITDGFPAARYGLFLHWGPYSPLGHGEQVLFRDHLDPREYEKAACAWNPHAFDAREWAKFAVESGMKVADLITHHFSPLDAPQAYHLLQTGRSSVMGVVFDWTRL